MRNFILAVTAVLLVTGLSARERRGPPPICPEPKVDCRPCKPPCPPKPCPKPCAPKPCAPVCKPKCEPKCPPPCDPCCPPVCLERGQADVNCCLPSAFVEPANIDLRCGWNTFFTVSFIYWEAMQDGMDLALPGQAVSLGPLNAVTNPALGNHVLFQDQEFEPGFQIGLGWSGGRDGWTLYGEYTWLRGTTHTSSTPPAPNVTQINGVNVGQFGVWIPTSFLPASYANNETNRISSKWHYGVDILDVQLSRPSYIGQYFVLEPLFGLRALWIRQNLNVTANVLDNAGNVAITAPTRSANYKSHSWAVGPRAGFDGKWLLGLGFRIIGDMSASLLFTRFTDVSENVESPSRLDLPISLEIEHYNTLRPNLDLSIGLGWGSYFLCRRMYWDLALTYDFSVFWNHNMMRYLADMMANGHTGAGPGNFYLQGLTLKTAFEF